MKTSDIEKRLKLLKHDDPIFSSLKNREIFESMKNAAGLTEMLKKFSTENLENFLNEVETVRTNLNDLHVYSEMDIYTNFANVIPLLSRKACKTTKFPAVI